MRVTLFSLCILLFIRCFSFNDGADRIDTHFLNGTVEHAWTEDVLPDVTIRISDRNCPFSFGTGCDALRLETLSDALGKFDINYESYCDAIINFDLPDSLDYVYGRCSRWSFEDLSNNIVQLGGCGSQQNLMTERDKNYDFLVRLQPQLYISFITNDNPDLEFENIEITKLGIETDSLFDLSGYFDISQLNDEIEIKITYTNGSIVMKNLGYDYLDDCIIGFDYDI